MKKIKANDSEKIIISEKKDQRNAGLDLLRLVAMFFIVFIHVTLLSGCLTELKFFSLSYVTVSIIDNFFCCAVNCFALITGYVCASKRKIKAEKLIALWLEVIFYSLSIAATAYIIKPGLITENMWLGIFTPVIKNTYWYFTAYTALYFLMPFINKMTAAITKHEFHILLGIITVLFGIVPNFFSTDLYGENRGFSFIWLTCMYLFGSYFKIHGFPKFLSKSKAVIIYILSSALQYIFYTSMIYAFSGKKIFFDFRNDSIPYNSPLLIIASIAFFSIFANLEIKNPVTGKFITTLAASAFGVYIIHTHPVFMRILMFGIFAPILKKPAFELFILFFLISAAVFIICLFTDVIREKISRLLKTETLIKKALDKISNKLKSK